MYRARSSWFTAFRMYMLMNKTYANTDVHFASFSMIDTIYDVVHLA